MNNQKNDSNNSKTAIDGTSAASSGVQSYDASRPLAGGVEENRLAQANDGDF